MVKQIAKVAFILLSGVLGGCVADVYNGDEQIPGGGPNPYGDMVIPSDFDWKMVYEVPLEVKPHDTYNSQYRYLIEVFNGEPGSADAKLLATGVANNSLPFNKRIVYPKGASNVMYIRQTDPTGIQLVKTVTLEPGKDNQYTFGASLSAETPNKPENQTPRENPISDYTLLVEDSFPDYGDFDFNDHVIQVRMESVSNEKGYLDKLLLSVTIRAVGATKRCGAYIHFPTIDVSSVKSMSMDGWKVTPEAGSPYPLMTLSEDLHRLFHFSGQLVNTEAKSQYRGQYKTEVVVEFAPDKVKDFTISELDLFTSIAKKEGEQLRTEVHLREFDNTEKGMNYRCYSEGNHVWALLIPGVALYPLEHMFIANAYPDLSKWIQGGSPFWYQKGKESLLYLKEEESE